MKILIWRVTFFNSFYHKEIMGLTSGLPEASSAHWDKMNCRPLVNLRNYTEQKQKCTILISLWIFQSDLNAGKF